jgi:hypothetical protein
VFECISLEAAHRGGVARRPPAPSISRFLFLVTTINWVLLYSFVGDVLLVWIVGLFAVPARARRAASISPAVATRSV